MSRVFSDKVALSIEYRRHCEVTCVITEVYTQ